MKSNNQGGGRSLLFPFFARMLFDYLKRGHEYATMHVISVILNYPLGQCEPSNSPKGQGEVLTSLTPGRLGLRIVIF